MRRSSRCRRSFWPKTRLPAASRPPQNLSRLYAFVTATHNTCFTIEVLALEALLHHAQGNEQARSPPWNKP